MSWSFSAIGKPHAVKRAIEESHNNKLTGQSLDEWNEAKPALLALVDGNVGGVAVRVEANGHATFADGLKTFGQCRCVVESYYGFVEE